ncbi:MAG TPA: hypothetical protein VEW27_14585 [Methylomirabilota bacterium]|nr:hypothetical protein [Methylomirabilota bacterium]
MFKKGVRSKPAGRKRGATTTRVPLMRELAEMIVTDPEVQAKLFEQARAGKLQPRLMLEFFRYHGGKPPERVEVVPPKTDSAELAALVGQLSKEDRRALADLSRKMIALEESSQDARGPQI